MKTLFLSLFKRKKQNFTPYQLDIIWSKGLKEKDEYCLSPTGYSHTEEELKARIASAKKNLYIKFGSDLKNLPSLLYLLKEPITLITSDGDGSIPKDLGLKDAKTILEHKFIKKWLTQNYDGTLQHPKLTPYPIGLDLHSKQWMIANHPLGKVNYMFSLREKYPQKINKILCDTYITRARHLDRKNFCHELKKSDHVKFLKTRKGIKKIYKLYSEYQFVVSPHGGGLDCHRTWEVLLLGSIPIVKSSALDPLYKDLPVVIVKDWSECKDPKNLSLWSDRYSHLSNIDSIKEKLSYDYWLTAFSP